MTAGSSLAPSTSSSFVCKEKVAVSRGIGFYAVSPVHIRFVERASRNVCRVSSHLDFYNDPLPARWSKQWVENRICARPQGTDVTDITAIRAGCRLSRCATAQHNHAAHAAVRESQGILRASAVRQPVPVKGTTRPRATGRQSPGKPCYSRPVAENRTAHDQSH